jgi:hypothetical protein
MAARLTAADRLLRAVTETQFQEQVIALARYGGWKVAHYRPAQRGRGPDGRVRWSTPVAADGAGFPDLILAGPGRLLGLELKRELGRVEPAQVDWLLRLQAAGAEVAVWRPSDGPLAEAVLLRGARLPTYSP